MRKPITESPAIEIAHRREIELIFARSCADSLADPLDNMLRSELTSDQQQAFADAAGALYAGAYAHLLEAFVKTRRSGCTSTSSASSSASPAAPQSD